MVLKNYFTLILFCIIIGSADAQKNKNSNPGNTDDAGKQWSVDKANAWYAQHNWIVGADYIPSNAINQLEMWQAQTFDSATNDKELSWAENIGFNTMRVFFT